MNRKEREEVFKAINGVANRVNDVSQKLDDGVITFSDVRNSYESWKGSLKGKKSYYTLQNTNKLFNELFIEDWRLKHEE